MGLGPGRQAQAEREAAHLGRINLNGDFAVPRIAGTLGQLHALGEGDVRAGRAVLFHVDAVLVRGVEEEADLGEQLDDVRRAAGAAMPFASRGGMSDLSGVLVEEPVPGERERGVEGVVEHALRRVQITGLAGQAKQVVRPLEVAEDAAGFAVAFIRRDVVGLGRVPLVISAEGAARAMHVHLALLKVVPHGEHGLAIVGIARRADVFSDTVEQERCTHRVAFDGALVFDGDLVLGIEAVVRASLVASPLRDEPAAKIQVLRIARHAVETRQRLLDLFLLLRS